MTTKTYTAICAPLDTAPPGELGRADWFEFEVTAADDAAALEEAQNRLAALIGTHAIKTYTITLH